MNTTNTLNGVVLASRDEVTEHAENATVHIAEEERASWNAKADASQLASKADAATFTAHETNTTVHVSQEEKEKWNARTTKGVVAATQDGLDEHAENTTVHVTEEERTAWNSAAAIPEASTAYTGDNTHAGIANLYGPVILNDAVSSPKLEEECVLSQIFGSSCTPFHHNFGNEIRQWGPMGFSIHRPSDGRPVRVYEEAAPQGWWSQESIAVQLNFTPSDNIFEISSNHFKDITAPLEDNYAYAHTLKRPGNATGNYISIQIDCQMHKFRLKYHSKITDNITAPGVLTIYEWDMPKEFYDVHMTRILYVFRRDTFDVFYVTSAGELKCLAATPGANIYAINFANMLAHTNCVIDSALLHVNNGPLMDLLNSRTPPYERSKWVERNSDAPLKGIELSPSGGIASLTLKAAVGCGWTLVSKPDWLDVGAENWKNGAVVTVSAGAAEETRHGSLILGTDGNHAVAGVKAYEKVVITQTVEA